MHEGLTAATVRLIEVPIGWRERGKVHLFLQRGRLKSVASQERIVTADRVAHKLHVGQSNKHIAVVVVAKVESLAVERRRVHYMQCIDTVLLERAQVV